MPIIKGSTWLLIASLYATQALALMFFVVALVAILRSGGASLDTIGLVYMLGLIWPLKLLWAPLVDRLRLGWLGHYRGWLLVTQSILIAVLLLIGQFDVTEDFGTVYLLCMVVSLASSTQDVAVDGLVRRLLPEDQRGLANGLQVAGGMVGNLVGGGVMLMAYPLIGWRGCMVAMSIITAVPLVQLVFFAEPQWKGTAVPAVRLYRRLAGFWWQEGNGYWLVMLILMPVAGGMAYAMLTPLLVDAGWGPGQIGLNINVLGSVAGVGAALVAGLLICRIPRSRALVTTAFMQIAGVLAVTTLALGWASGLGASVAVIGYFLFYSPLAATMSTLMMDRAAAESAATDFTLQFSVQQFAAIAAMTVGSVLAASMGYLGVLAVATAFGILGLVLTLGFRGRVQTAEPLVEAR